MRVAALLPMCRLLTSLSERFVINVLMLRCGWPVHSLLRKRRYAPVNQLHLARPAAPVDEVAPAATCTWILQPLPGQDTCYLLKLRNLQILTHLHAGNVAMYVLERSDVCWCALTLRAREPFLTRRASGIGRRVREARAYVLYVCSVHMYVRECV